MTLHREAKVMIRPSMSLMSRPSSKRRSALRFRESEVCEFSYFYQVKGVTQKDQTCLDCRGLFGGKTMGEIGGFRPTGSSSFWLCVKGQKLWLKVGLKMDNGFEKSPSGSEGPGRDWPVRTNTCGVSAVSLESEGLQVCVCLGYFSHSFYDVPNSFLLL